MRNILMTMLKPAIISALLVLPLIIIELVNRRNLPEDFPIVLFAILWLLGTIFFLLLIPVVKYIRRGIKNSLPGFLFRLAILVLTGWLWVVIVIDQVPCFLAVPNCD
jgi:hypothetical protein